MGQKWGSNEGIHIGDIFQCWGASGFCPLHADYYQVVGVQGRTRVVLRAIRQETFIDEGIRKDSTLLRERTRPLPGEFMTMEELGYGFMSRNGRHFLPSGVEVTAWVLPQKSVEGRYLLQEIGWKKGVTFTMSLREDWEPWDADTIKKLEAEDYEMTIAAMKSFAGEEGFARYCKEHAADMTEFAKRCMGEEGYAEYCKAHAAEMRKMFESKPDGYDG